MIDALCWLWAIAGDAPRAQGGGLNVGLAIMHHIAAWAWRGEGLAWPASVMGGQAGKREGRQATDGLVRRGASTAATAASFVGSPSP